jgi:hypothetical protein
MKRKLLPFLLILALMPVLAAAESWENVPMVDGRCASMVKADPDAHTRECMLKCQNSGYGILTSDGKYLKFDADGNAKALELLKNSNQKDHLRVTVEGKQKGETIQVKSLKM